MKGSAPADPFFFNTYIRVMKSLLVFAVVLFYAKSFAQIKYAPVFIDPCTHQVVGYGSTISDSNANEFFDHGLFTTEYRLPQLGQYILHADWEEFEVVVQITSENQKDTFLIPNLQIPICVCSPPNKQYDFCGQIAEGYHVDFYQEGKIRREGTFKNGFPTDTVKTYFYTGEIKEYHIPQKRGDKRVAFYQNGNLKRLADTKKERYENYYESGQLSSLTQFKRKQIEEEYFENGRLKREQNERKEVRYAQSGFVTDILKRKIAFGIFSRRYRWYEIRWKRFNSKDEVQFEITLIMDEYPRYPKEITEIDRNDIEQIVLFKEGKPTQKIVVNSDYVEGEFVYSTTIFEQTEGDWVEVRTGTLEALNEFL